MFSLARSGAGKRSFLPATALLITVTALMAQGLTDTSFRHHLEMAKANGITRSEIAEILTHAAFYAGWPKAWAAFRMAKEVWAENEASDAKQAHRNYQELK